MEQQILSYKFQKVKHLFQQKKNNPNQEGNENIMLVILTVLLKFLIILK